MKCFVFKKSIYTWEKFSGFVYFYNFIRAKFWLLGKSKNHLKFRPSFSVVLNVVRAMIGTVIGFDVEGCQLLFSVFAFPQTWVPSWRDKGCRRSGRPRAQTVWAAGRSQQNELPHTPSADFSLSPPSFCSASACAWRWVWLRPGEALSLGGG